MLEALKEKVRVLGEKMKGLKEKVKAAAGKAVDKINKRAKEFFVSVGKKVKKVGKKAWAMRKEMSAVLILAIFGVVLFPFLLKYFVVWVRSPWTFLLMLSNPPSSSCGHFWCGE